MDVRNGKRSDSLKKGDDLVQPKGADLLRMTKNDRLLASAFLFPDVAFVFNDSKSSRDKLYVNKEELSKVSPVFAAMFSSNFKEATACQIPLPGKKMSAFMHFLRWVLPGHVDQMKVEIAHEVLPLAQEYQTFKLKDDIDLFLSTETMKSDDTIIQTELIENIIEAELYGMKMYLKACIDVASKRKSTSLVSEKYFRKISKDTQLKIAHQRLQNIERIYRENIWHAKWEDKPTDEDDFCFEELLNDRPHSFYAGDGGKDDWRYEYLNNNATESSWIRCRTFLQKLKEHFDVYMK